MIPSRFDFATHGTPWSGATHARTRYGLAAHLRTTIFFRAPMCLPAAPELPIAGNENFGTLSFWKQLSRKLINLPVCATYAFSERSASPSEKAEGGTYHQEGRARGPPLRPMRLSVWESIDALLFFCDVIVLCSL
jgi:hypothetical protein